MEEYQSEQTMIARLIRIEKEIGALKENFSLYVLLRENELHLKSIYTMLHLKEKQLASARAKLVTQNLEAQNREMAQRQEWAALQIKALWGSIITGVLVSFLVISMMYVIHKMCTMHAFH